MVLDNHNFVATGTSYFSQVALTAHALLAAGEPFVFNLTYSSRPLARMTNCTSDTVSGGAVRGTACVVPRLAQSFSRSPKHFHIQHNHILNKTSSQHGKSQEPIL